jgi:hypothetical protein
LTYEQAFTVMVIDVNESPTAVQLSNSVVPEDLSVGMTVGMLSTTGPDSGDTFAYSLVAGAGSTDNSSLGISGNTLPTAIPFADKTGTAIASPPESLIRAGRLLSEPSLSLHRIRAMPITEEQGASTRSS